MEKDKELAVDLTKSYIDAYIRGVFSDQNAILAAKTKAISVEVFESAYKRFYEMLSNTPEET